MQYYGDEFLTSVDPATGTKFADTEKLDDDGSVAYGDSELCWAATASNMLQAQGWTVGTGISSEDGTFDYFVANWVDGGGNPRTGIIWWMNNTLDYLPGDEPDSYPKYPADSRTGFWPDTDPVETLVDNDWFTQIVSEGKSAGTEVLDILKRNLRLGGVLGLNIFSRKGSGHSITCWGYEVDDEGKLWLYLSDSDDNKGEAPVRSDMPDNLVRVQAEIDKKDGNLYLRNYMNAYNNYAIVEVTTLFRRDDDYDYALKQDIESAAVNLNFSVSDSTLTRAARIDRAGDTDYFTVTSLVSKALNFSLGTMIAGAAANMVLSVYNGAVSAQNLLGTASGSDASCLVQTQAGQNLTIVVRDNGTDLSAIENSAYRLSAEYEKQEFRGLTITGTADYYVNDHLISSTVADGGVLRLGTGAGAEDLTISAGGRAELASGAALSGTISLGGTLSLDGKAGIDASTEIRITLQNQQPESFSALITGEAVDFAFRDPVVVVSVSDSDVKGAYKLAEGLQTPLASIIVRAGNIRYTLSAGGEFSTEKTGYQLAISDAGELILTVTDPIEDARLEPRISASITTPTRSAVSISAGFNAGSQKNQYSLNGGKTWKTYKKPFRVTRNSTILFRSILASGETAQASFTVANIDKVKPKVMVPALTTDGCNVVLYASADGTGSGIAGYEVKYKSKTQKSIILSSASSTIALHDLAYGLYTYQIRVTDEAGNRSGWSRSEKFAIQNNAPDTDGEMLISNGTATVAGYVGVGDSMDTYTFVLDCAGEFNFTATELDSRIKMSVYNANGKRLGTVTAKEQGAAFSKPLLLDKGGYYFRVESADQGKGKYNTDYKIEFAGTSFHEATTNDDWSKGLFRDYADLTDDEWVGFGDASDAFRFHVDTDGTRLDIKTGANVKLELYDSSSKRIQTGTGKMLTKMVDAGDYFINVVAIDKGKSAKGNTAYSLAVSPLVS